MEPPDAERSTVDVATDQLDKLIERRSTSDPDPDEREESYMQSVRAYHARQRLDHLEEWRLFHLRQMASHRATFREIIRRHKAGLAECERALGITDSEAAKEGAA